MKPTRDPEVIFAAWLDEGPMDLPDATRRAILTACSTPGSLTMRLAWVSAPAE